MLLSLVRQYRQRGEAMLENTPIWVCTICGFIYLGEKPPAVCPVCKVPAWKFEEVKGRAAGLKLFAVRNLRLCTKDCLCLYVCPTGASDTEDSIIDVKTCIGCGHLCSGLSPAALSRWCLMDYPPQQKKARAVLDHAAVLAESKARQEAAARSLGACAGGGRSCPALCRRRTQHPPGAEDLSRESGYMLPQSAAARNLLEDLLADPPTPDFPAQAARELLERIPSNE